MKALMHAGRTANGRYRPIAQSKRIENHLIGAIFRDMVENQFVNETLRIGGQVNRPTIGERWLRSPPDC